MLEDFQSALEEVQQVQQLPSRVDYQQFSTLSIFSSIVSQEEYISYTEKRKPFYNVLAEEQKLLDSMVAQTKRIFGEDYQDWYNAAKQYISYSKEFRD